MEKFTAMKISRNVFILFTLLFNLQLSAQEICDNRIDDDGDGLIDCLDPDCSGNETCWECLTEFYQVHSNNTLVLLDPINGTYTTLGNISGATAINGAQFNQVDGHVYAPCTINGLNRLGMLQNNGVVIDTGLDLPGNGMFYVGSIDGSGVMYISNSLGIHSIDLTQSNLSVVNTGVSHPGVADLALDITRELFYGITGSSKLKVFDPSTMTVTQYNLAGSIVNESGAFGAAWSSSDGSFFAYNNSSGKIYTVDVNNLTATEVLNGTGNLSINDGFNCVLAPPPFESNCGNGVDDDGDGVIDCNDPDCYNSNVCTTEICNDGIDNDNDGWTDCSDSECFTVSYCLEICNNGIDDNGNGLIDGDDPQCGTSSGVTGGLESNRRLSEKISLRNFYTRILDSKQFNEKLEGIIPFETSAEKENFNIESFIPQEVLDAYVAESAPIDLIGITNAIDVAAADYYVDNQRVASILGIQSEDGVYEHTKYICDRLDGARLIDISYLYARGGNFISYELINNQGQKEYAVSFSAKYNASEGFTLESHWNLHKYSKNEDYYNIQIWANSYSNLIEILEASIDLFNEEGILAAINFSEIPKVFVTYGDYKNGKLDLSIKNKNQTQSITFQASLTRNEGGDLEDFNIEIPLTGNNEQRITVETGHLYDLGASIVSADSPNDEIFLADGAWGIDEQNPNAEVINFNVYQEDDFYEEDVYQIERSITAEANVKDYLNIYRSLDAKLKSKHLDQFNSLVFNASGKATVEITIVKESISDWEDQYRSYIELEESETEYILLKDHFLSSTLSDQINLNDVTMIVFTLLGDNQDASEKSITLSQIRFQNSTISSNKEEVVNSSLNIYPNPVSEIFNLDFNSTINSQATINLYDHLGRAVYTEPIRLTNGINQFKLDLGHLNSGMYFFSIDKISDIKGKIIIHKE